MCFLKCGHIGPFGLRRAGRLNQEPCATMLMVSHGPQCRCWFVRDQSWVLCLARVEFAEFNPRVRWSDYTCSWSFVGLETCDNGSNLSILVKTEMKTGCRWICNELYYTYIRIYIYMFIFIYIYIYIYIRSHFGSRFGIEASAPDHHDLEGSGLG